MLEGWGEGISLLNTFQIRDLMMGAESKKTKLMALETNPTVLAGFLVHKEMPLKH